MLLLAGQLFFVQSWTEDPRVFTERTRKNVFMNFFFSSFTKPLLLISDTSSFRNIVFNGMINERWRNTHPPVPTKQRLTRMYGGLVDPSNVLIRSIGQKIYGKERFHFQIETRPKWVEGGRRRFFLFLPLLSSDFFSLLSLSLSLSSRLRNQLRVDVVTPKTTDTRPLDTLPSTSTITLDDLSWSSIGLRYECLSSGDPTLPLLYRPLANTSSLAPPILKQKFEASMGPAVIDVDVTMTGDYGWIWFWTIIIFIYMWRH
jgi:hypothetical protein